MKVNKKNLIIRSKRILKFAYLKIMRIRGTPEFIAQGLALGIFIGFTPTMGFQMVLSAFIATILRQNIIATVTSVWITNVFTFIPIYSFNYAVGKYVFNGSFDIKMKTEAFSSMKALFSMGWEFLYTLWIGSLIVAIVGSIITYYVSVPLVKKFQEKRRHLRKIIREHKKQKHEQKTS